jgi:signal transduction histidine kinase
MIISQSRQLRNHVDRILLFASIRSGKDRYNLRTLGIAEILQRVRDNTSALIQEESYTVEEHVEPDLPGVFGDLFAISGCLENLITNAVKYGREDRRICISATLHEAKDKGQVVAIAVQDHGIGIKSSELKHIFEPFYRSPEAASAQIHGTGLGLSLANHLAQAMGGSLSAVSEVGVGSVFILRLPIAVAEENEPEMTGATKQRG